MILLLNGWVAEFLVSSFREVSQTLHPQRLLLDEVSAAIEFAAKRSLRQRHAFGTCVSRKVRFDHLRRIDDAVELLFRNDTSAWNERAVFSLVERRRRAARRPSVVVLEV